MKPGAAIIAAASGYECLSIVAGYTPTITTIVRSLPPPVRAGLCAAFSGWLFAHMLLEAAETAP